MREKWYWMAGIIFYLLTIHPNTFFAENSSLQDLVDQTPAHGTLLLQNKTYTGNVMISKPITIRGSGKTNIKGDGTGNVILIQKTALGSRLENLRISHSSKSRNSVEEYSAIKVLSDRNILKNLTISDSFHGIYFSSSNENDLSNVRITGMGGGEIAGQGNGIQLIRSQRNRLTNAVIRDSRDGIYFSYSNDNVVKKVDISHTRYGLHYMYSDHNHFFNNHFHQNIGGAAIMNSKGIELIGNEFSSQQGSRSFGLMLQASDENKVEDNHFYHNQRGLYIDMSQKNRIISNEFLQNRIGVELWASSSSQVFSLNRFFRNTLPVITIGGQAQNQWSEDHKGNEWGETFALFDLNEDMIGDIPVKYKSSLAKLMEDQELVYLFLPSPSIHIYEKINQFLHRQETVFTDPYPLMSDRGNGLPAVWFLLIPVMIILGIIFVKRRRRIR
ncbi:nitrous oxide reductase family maturation protein NosD [Neobacillus drentensis]|uniref:nitrous oxide reductase family maturation protein NosD n=1 Tax=Neobacillus drentensis TaxID=220684 RepID=UPI00286063BD|nr:nitrous oxide reductase family maturation protein NosD [Neobacillus drentensis]MDR7237464.1 nitrous oxidase accessory protein [Neobacillus drentensis]